MGPAYLAAYTRKSLIWPDLGMRERGFNTIISGMIVSHYSAVASSTRMMEGCLWRGGRDVSCRSYDATNHLVDYRDSPSLLLSGYF